MLKVQQLNTYIITLFLALGNIVWFANFTLGTVKIVLMILIVILNINVFLNPRNYVGFFWFLILTPFLIFTAVNSHGTVNDKIYWLYGFAENYLFLMLGYSCFVRGEDVGRMLKMIVPLTVFFCVLIIGNFIWGVPHWVSPIAKAAYTSAVNNGYIGAELAPMYSTGLGIARTGWATTLCSYLPLTHFFINNKRLFYPAYVIIALTAILSASRGGLFLTLFITTILFVKSSNGGAFKTISILSIATLFLLTMPYITDIEHFLRLPIGGGNLDFSTGRTSQYEHIPDMLREGGLFGLGIHGTFYFLKSQGIHYDLHNTYMRVLCEYGMFVGLTMIGLSIWLLKTIIKDIKNEKNLKLLSLPLVLLSGILSGLWEPQAVFGTVNWWCLWWFVLGGYIASKKGKKDNNDNGELTNNVEYNKIE